MSYLVRRLLQMVPTLFGVSLLCFILIHLVPGNPARVIAGVDATQEEVDIISDQLGLGKPLYEQYGDYIWNLIHGDFGMSMRSDKPVLQEILTRLPTTVTLAVMSLIIMVIVGILAGIFSATKPNSLRDNLTMMVSLFGISIPIYWSGIMLMLVFSYYIALLPSGGNSSITYFIMPSIVLGISSSAILARLTRSSMLEVINQEFIRTARAKGAKETIVIYKHALKNSLIPIITIIGLEFGSLLGGAVITETVFSMNGIGQYIVQSIQFRDYPAIQGSILFVATLFVVINLVVDLCYSLVDPRVRYD